MWNDELNLGCTLAVRHTSSRALPSAIMPSAIIMYMM